KPDALLKYAVMQMGGVGGKGERDSVPDINDFVEQIKLEAPEGDSLQLELASFVRAAKGEEAVAVSGAEGLDALRLAFRVMEVVKKIPAQWRLMKRIERRLAQGDVKLLVLVDYPGFHLRLAKVAKRLGVPVLYYIAPQLWAWHESRVKQLAANVAELAVILPF